MKSMNDKIVECGGSRATTLVTNTTILSIDVIVQCKQYSGTLIQADRARELLGS
jgi:hypothetical protein